MEGRSELLISMLLKINVSIVVSRHGFSISPGQDRYHSKGRIVMPNSPFLRL